LTIEGNRFKCVSNYCGYDHYNNCTQECKSIDNPPYFECSCSDDYFKVEMTNDCKLKEGKNCDQCKDSSYCKSGKCVCKEGYDYVNETCVLSNKSMYFNLFFTKMITSINL